MAPEIATGFRNRKVHGNLVRIMTIVPLTPEPLILSSLLLPELALVRWVGPKDRGDGIEGVVERMVAIQTRGYSRASRKWRQSPEKTLVNWEEPRGTVRRTGGGQREVAVFVASEVGHFWAHKEAGEGGG